MIANNYVRQVIIYVLFGQEESETGLGEEDDEERLNVNAYYLSSFFILTF
jgi:hypothetical protein